MSDETLTLETRGTRPAFFADPDLDALMTALLETMSQLWATRDYARALEQTLIDKDLLSPGEVDGLEWSAAQYVQNDAARAAFFADAFRAVGANFQGAGRRTQEIDDAGPDAEA